MAQVHGVDYGVWQQHAWRNRLQSLALLAALSGFMALLGWLLWGRDGILILLLMGGIAVLFNPSLSPRWVMRLYGARRLTAAEAPRLWSMLQWLAERASLRGRLELYYIPSRMLNAFAVGSRQQAAVAVTDGLLRRLEPRELAGVLAHEVSHVRSNDLWVMGLADMLSRATSLLSLTGQFLLLLNLPLLLLTDASINWLAIALLIFAPSLSALAQLALSRTREFDADLNAASLTGDPDGLASALVKIERIQGGWLERIFMPGRRVPEPSLLRSHPLTEQRIARLLALKPRLQRADRYRPGTTLAELQRDLGREVVRRPGWHITGLWH